MCETNGLVTLTNGPLDRIDLGSGLGLFSYICLVHSDPQPFSRICGEATLVKKRFLGSEFSTNHFNL